MSTSVRFFLVDVFTDTPLTGNPLAVVADAEQLEEPLMRAMAREFNQSETTFVLPPTRPGATWRLQDGLASLQAQSRRSCVATESGSPEPVPSYARKGHAGAGGECVALGIG
jgi:hypothetical protein